MNQIQSHKEPFAIRYINECASYNCTNSNSKIISQYDTCMPLVATCGSDIMSSWFPPVLNTTTLHPGYRFKSKLLLGITTRNSIIPSHEYARLSNRLPHTWYICSLQIWIVHVSEMWVLISFSFPINWTWEEKSTSLVRLSMSIKLDFTHH